MRSLWNREPAAILGVVQTVLALVVAFGLKLTPEQVGAIMAASSAVVALVTRRTVSSPATVAALTDGEA